jgi:hypothetical protein
MSEAIKTTYRDVEIVYLEDPNKWRFTANGRERSAESLVKAREAIDRTLDKEVKEKPWEPFEAYFNRYADGDPFKKVLITSVAEGRSYSGVEVWVKDGNSRSKESLRHMYKVCPENEATIAELVRLAAEKKAIEKKVEREQGKLILVELPA